MLGPRPGTRGTPRGFTFTEVMIVIVLAGVVTLGLVTFYLNSQAWWTESSTQVLAQRDATNLVEFMRDKAQGATNVLVLPSGSNSRVIFYDGVDETDEFFWAPADSFVHHGSGPSGTDQGPVVPTIVERFLVSVDPTPGLVNLDTLQVRSISGRRVTLSTTIGLYNQ